MAEENKHCCCPVGSEPELSVDYKPTGQEVEIAEGQKLYFVGDESSGKGIIVSYVCLILL